MEFLPVPIHRPSQTIFKVNQRLISHGLLHPRSIGQRVAHVSTTRRRMRRRLGVANYFLELRVEIIQAEALAGSDVKHPPGSFFRRRLASKKIG
jgi:hypothetical protein